MRFVTLVTDDVHPAQDIVTATDGDERMDVSIVHSTGSFTDGEQLPHQSGGVRDRPIYVTLADAIG